MLRSCRTESGKEGREVYVNDDIEEGHIIKINKRFTHSSTHIANMPSIIL